MLGKADRVERRLQRWLNHPRLIRTEYQQAWVGWVLSKLEDSQPLTLLVDETKLSEHLHVMLVGLAWQRRCLPLVWRSYAPQAWPEGQVMLISHLLQQVKARLPTTRQVVGQVDRGLGTSPSLVRAVKDDVHWH